MEGFLIDRFQIEHRTMMHTSSDQDIRRAWTSTAFSTEPAERAKAEGACARVYRALGLPPPNLCLWLESPLAAYLAAFFYVQLAEVECVDPGVDPAPYVTAQVQSADAQRVAMKVWESVMPLFAARYYPLWEAGSNTGLRIMDAVFQEIKGREHLGKGHEQGSVLLRVLNGIQAQERWPNCFSAIRSEVVSEADGKLAHALQSLSLEPYDEWQRPFVVSALRSSDVSPVSNGVSDIWKSAGGWWPFRRVAIFAERPQRLKFDQEERLHSHDGMAMQYRDGWGLYAWHGVRVSEQVIRRPETVTFRQVIHEPNAEVRRVMIERHGLDRLLTHSHASVIDVDQDGNRLLYRLNLSGDEPVVAVRVTCPSTGQIYFLRVPPGIRTCRAAVAWTFWFEKLEEYKPLVET